jgi:hypothetical protein
VPSSRCRSPLKITPRRDETRLCARYQAVVQIVYLAVLAWLLSTVAAQDDMSRIKGSQT